MLRRVDTAKDIYNLASVTDKIVIMLNGLIGITWTGEDVAGFYEALGGIRRHQRIPNRTQVGERVAVT